MTSCYHRSRTVPLETQTPSFEHVHIPGTCSSNMGTAKKFVTLPSPPARTPSSRFSRLPFFDSIFPKISSRYAYRARRTDNLLCALPPWTSSVYFKNYLLLYGRMVWLDKLIRKKQIANVGDQVPLSYTCYITGYRVNHCYIRLVLPTSHDVI